MDVADNWYVVLDLEFDPPVEDEQEITKKIDERSKFWSMHFNDFKKGAQYRSWHQNIPQMKKDMLGPTNIREQLAAEACTIVYGPVDKLLKTIGRKGNITEGEADKLAKKLKISLDVVKKRAKVLGIQWIVGMNTDYQSIYDKYYKIKPQNAAAYDGMKQMLSSFGVENLYDFLYTDSTVKNVNNLPCNTLRLRAEEKKKTEFYKHDSISGTGTKLCGQCEIVFKDENSKELYDKYLEYRKRRSILDDVKNISEISEELTAEQGNEIIGQLTKIVKDRKLADEILTAFCKAEKISYHPGTASENHDIIKICRCGCINNVSDGRKICSNCGLELIIKCPECGTENDANIKICKCGFKFENIDKTLALCEQAELAINNLDFIVAKAHLDDANRYWPDSSKVDSLRKHLAEMEKCIGKEVNKMRDAIKSRYYCEAQNRYQRIRTMFSSYSDTLVEEEINQAIEKAKVFYNRAKKAKTEKDILELCEKAFDLCADLPGIKELMPAPGIVTEFKVDENSISRSNVVSWASNSDRSIRFVLVRSQDGWVQNISDGKIIFQGSASSYTDNDVEAGRTYYYNVFAERAGVYSKGALGVFKEVVNLFEIRQVIIIASDASLNIKWDVLPPNATAEIYRIQSNGMERHIVSIATNNYLITGLENDKNYRYRVSLSYIVAGKKQETKGVVVSGTPSCPPLPIDSLRVKPIQEGQFGAIWYKPNVGEVRLYGSNNKPGYLAGDSVAITELEQKMFQLQQKNVSSTILNSMKQGETGALFDYSGSDILYVVAVVVKSDTAVFGNLVRAGVGETITVKSIKPVNGKINIYIDLLSDVTGFVVLYRFDRFPLEIGDVNTVRKYIPLKQYQLNSAIVLDNLEERKYYFTIYAEFKEDGEKDYSAGTEYLFDNTAKVNIKYSITVNKKMFGESNVVLKFEADTREFVLPDIEVMSSIGNAPIFKDSATLFYTIGSQQVNGSIEVKIPIPKNMPKNTYIRAFIKDESMQSRNQLQLKLKSNYKIN